MDGPRLHRYMDSEARKLLPLHQAPDSTRAVCWRSANRSAVSPGVVSAPLSCRQPGASARQLDGACDSRDVSC